MLYFYFFVMNSHKNTPSPPQRFVDTTSNENLVAVYEKNVRFNFYLDPGERQVYLDAMKVRGINIEKYLRDEAMARSAQEGAPLNASNMKAVIRDRFNHLVESQ